MPSQEAAASGCAIVTTDVGAARDVFVDGETALFSPPRDPCGLSRNIVRLLEDENLLKTLGTNVHRRIGEFTWERTARDLLGYLTL